jgi:hypothetical protein
VYKPFVLVVLGMILSLAADAQLPVRPTGVFSDMHSTKGAGDIVGTEIFITYGGENIGRWSSRPKVKVNRI